MDWSADRKSAARGPDRDDDTTTRLDAADDRELGADDRPSFRKRDEKEHGARVGERGDGERGRVQHRHAAVVDDTAPVQRVLAVVPAFR